MMTTFEKPQHALLGALKPIPRVVGLILDGFLPYVWPRSSDPGLAASASQPATPDAALPSTPVDCNSLPSLQFFLDLKGPVLFGCRGWVFLMQGVVS